jgi:hypothetical protein
MLKAKQQLNNQKLKRHLLMRSREVVLFRAHNTIEIPGIGNLGPVMPSGTKTLIDLSMKLDEGYVFAKFSYNKVPYELAFNTAGLAYIKLAPENDK